MAGVILKKSSVILQTFTLRVVKRRMVEFRETIENYRRSKKHCTLLKHKIITQPFYFKYHRDGKKI